MYKYRCYEQQKINNILRSTDISIFIKIKKIIRNKLGFNNMHKVSKCLKYRLSFFRSIEKNNHIEPFCMFQSRYKRQG